jgi:hypothetical protein
MTRKLLTALFGTLLFTLPACGGVEDASSETGSLEQALSCAAYLTDNPNYTGPLAPWPVSGIGCINLPSASDNRTSSFRLTGCPVQFFDGPSCSGVSYTATASGVMPLGFDNRTTSLRFF